MFKSQLLGQACSLLVAAFLAVPCFAQGQGALIFKDNFDTADSFKENWGLAEGIPNIKWEDGKVLISPSGVIQMKSDTPLNFCAEMELTFLDKNNPNGNSRVGFVIDGKYFMIMPEGKAFLFGYKAIPDFETGKPVKMTLSRTCSKNGAEYVFKANGMEVTKMNAELPKEIQKALAEAGGAAELENLTVKSSPLMIFANGTNVSIDNFQLWLVKSSGAGASSAAGR